MGWTLTCRVSGKVTGGLVGPHLLTGPEGAVRVMIRYRDGETRSCVGPVGTGAGEWVQVQAPEPGDPHPVREHPSQVVEEEPDPLAQCQVGEVAVEST